MSEEIIPKEETPKPTEEKKGKRWLKPLLFSTLGIILAITLIFTGYQLGQKGIPSEPGRKVTPTASPEVTPSTGVYHVASIDLTVDRALRVEGKADKDLLVLTVTFAANTKCPLTGVECRYDTRGFRLVDEEGFVQEMPVSFPKVKYLITNPISQRALKLGEKDKGDVFFDIPKDKNKFFLTYSQAGETSEKILIEPELFDPTAGWKTYTSAKHGFTIKYPGEINLKEEEDSSVTLTLWGPTQKTETEFYDGLGLRFNSGSLGGKTLKDFVEEKINEAEEAEAEILIPLTPITIGGVSGYTYRIRGLGESTSIYVSVKPGSYIEIDNFTSDPTGKGFEETAELILSTFKFLK